MSYYLFRKIRYSNRQFGNIFVPAAVLQKEKIEFIAVNKIKIIVPVDTHVDVNT